MITHVICFLLGVSYPGIVVERNGDEWLVQFKVHTEWVNSNRCREVKK